MRAERESGKGRERGMSKECTAEIWQPVEALQGHLELIRTLEGLPDCCECSDWLPVNAFHTHTHGRAQAIKASLIMQ